MRGKNEILYAGRKPLLLQGRTSLVGARGEKGEKMNSGRKPMPFIRKTFLSRRKKGPRPRWTNNKAKREGGRAKRDAFRGGKWGPRSSLLGMGEGEGGALCKKKALSSAGGEKRGGGREMGPKGNLSSC